MGRGETGLAYGVPFVADREGCCSTCARAWTIFCISGRAVPIVLKFEMWLDVVVIGALLNLVEGGGTRAHAHVRTCAHVDNPFLHLRNGLADCAQIWNVVRLRCYGWLPQLGRGARAHVRQQCRVH